MLLVFGGSQGARTLNTRRRGRAARAACARASAVLHAHGKARQRPAAAGAAATSRVPYIERMDLAYAAADAVLCRAGAMTVAEVSAVGLPAVYVPLPHGNGEQALNAAPGGRARAAVCWSTTPSYRGAGGRRARAAAHATRGGWRDGRRRRAPSGHADADERLARMVLD